MNAENIDMSRFIEAKSDQLNADDLMGGPRTITITRVSASDSEQPVNIHFSGDNNKPFRPCKTIRRVMVAVWGPSARDYVGRSMTIYRDDEVQFGGMKVGGIRISHMSHIDGARQVVVMKSKGKKAPMRILPLTNAARSAAPSRSPEGRPTPADTSEPPQHDAGSGAASSGDMSPRQKAEAWVAGMTQKIAEAEYASDLEFMLLDNAKASNKLEKEHPDLFAELQDCAGRRRASFHAEQPADLVDDDQ